MRQWINLFESEEMSPAQKVEDEFFNQIDQIAPKCQVSLHVHKPKLIELSHIYTKSEDRGKGFSSLALALLTSLADRYGVTIYLGVADDPEDDFPEDALVSWYERHGFDLQGGRRMVRKPQSPLIESVSPSKTVFILDLPEPSKTEALKAFKTLSDDQRYGDPEKLGGGSLYNRGIQASGLYSGLTEHVGDITHRMADHFEMRKGLSKPCKDKVELGLKRCADDIEGQVERNYVYASDPQRDEDHLKYEFETKTFKGSLSDYKKWWRDAGKRYGDAHASLTVWNEAQWHAREAAVAIGYMKFGLATAHLKELIKHLESPEEWARYAGQVTINADGHPVPYNRNLSESLSEAAKPIIIPEGFDTSKVWYHGGLKRLKKFDPRRMNHGELGVGVYLASNPSVAYSWARDEGQIMHCYIKKGDIFDLAKQIGRKVIDDLWQRHTAAMKAKWGQNEAGYSRKRFVEHILGRGKDALLRLLPKIGFVGAVDHTSQIPGQIVIFKPEDVFIFKITAGKDFND